MQSPDAKKSGVAVAGENVSKDKFKNNFEVIAPPTAAQALAEINNLDDDYLSYLSSLPDKVQTKIKNRINATRNGIHAVAPLTCSGPQNCPFIEKCPIPNRDSEGELEFGPGSNYPIGMECVLESIFMRQKITDYMQHLKVDPGNPVEVSIVGELALIDLYKNRCLMVMSSGDRSGQGKDFMRIDILGFNENGDTAEQAKIHPVIEVMDKLEKRREKWLDKLMETRKAKAEWIAKVGGGENDSRVLNEIKQLRDALLSISSRDDGEEDSEDILLD